MAHSFFRVGPLLVKSKKASVQERRHRNDTLILGQCSAFSLMNPLTCLKVVNFHWCHSRDPCALLTISLRSLYGNAEPSQWVCSSSFLWWHIRASQIKVVAYSIGDRCRSQYRRRLNCRDVRLMCRPYQVVGCIARFVVPGTFSSGNEVVHGGPDAHLWVFLLYIPYNTGCRTLPATLQPNFTRVLEPAYGELI